MFIVRLLAAILVIARCPMSGRDIWTEEKADPTLFSERDGVRNPAVVDQPLVVVLVDFPDGRLAGGGLPALDSDLGLVHNIDAVGSMGYVRDGLGGFRAKARKYTYEDYWDAVFAPLFSTTPYVGSRHPDFSTHEGYVPTVSEDPTQEIYRLEVFGSVRDYWDEVSYGRLLIQPSQTREYPLLADKYNSGIVNNVIRAGGKNYVQWICLPRDKPEYSFANGLDGDPIRATVETLRSLHQNPYDPEYLEFDIDAYKGKVAIIAAGGRLGGWAAMNAREFIVPEKMQYLQNHSPSVLFNPIRELAHEFGHAIGIEHQAVGPYDIMHCGSLGLRRHCFCPPHVNPHLKLRMGWLSQTDLVKITSGQSVSLPPITEASKKVALITLFGDAGRDEDYGHSEYFLVEYRTREKFNRFAGGPDAAFLGGALIWHYASTGRFPTIGGCDVTPYLALKVPNYGDAFKGTPGSPSDFFYSGNSALDSTTHPSSSSVDGYPTGISLFGFRESNESLQFTVSYDEGAIQVWDRFYRAADPISSPIRGTVYVEGTRSIEELSLADGCQLHISPGGSLVAWHCTATRSSVRCNGGSCFGIRRSVSVDGSLTIQGTGRFVLSSTSQLLINSAGNLTTEPGTTLDIRPGVTVRSGPDGIIIVRGKLIARGNALNHITFSSSGPTWSGLVLGGSGADKSVLEYVDVNNVQTAGGAAVSVIGAREVSFRNCAITHNVHLGTHGLFLWNASRPELAYNTISSNSGYGIILAGSSGYLYCNTIAANTLGSVFCGGWASPLFGKPDFDARNGNNTLTGGSIGVRASDYSYPCAGLSGSSACGYNTITGGSAARVSASDNSGVVAEMNFWGEHPRPSWFVTRTNSTVDWQPYLKSEAGEVTPLVVYPVAVDAESSEVEIAAAARCRFAGDYLHAKQILLSAICGAQADEEIARGAAELVALFSETGEPELLSFCRSARAHKKQPEAVFALAEAKILQLSGQTAEARTQMAELIVQFPGTACARTACVDLCLLSVCEPGVPGSVIPEVSSLRQLGEADDIVRIALWLLRVHGDQAGPDRQERRLLPHRGSETILTTVLEVFPNPFNASTLVQYRLAECADVVLSVFNALGQRVATLVEGEKEPGCYTVHFDASGLSTGAYLCRLQAGGVKQTSRMLLVR